MKRPQYRRPATKPLQCERLEARQVFASDLLAEVGDWSQADVQPWVASAQPTVLAADISTTTSSESGDSTLHTLVADDRLRPWNAGDVVNYYRNTHFYLNAWKAPALETVESQEQLQELLQKQAVEYWSDLFGASLSEKLEPWRGALIGREPALTNSLVAERRVADSLVIDTTSPTRPIASDALVYQLGNGMQFIDGFEATDDHFLYVVRGNEIAIIDARDPADLQVAATIDVGNVWAPKLFLAGNRLITVGQVSQNDPRSEIWQLDRYMLMDRSTFSSRTRVQVFDIADRTQPTLLQTFQIEGSLVDSQMRDGKLLLNQVHTTLFPAPQTVGTGSEERFETAEEYLARVSNQLLSSLMPAYQQGISPTSLTDSETLGQWQDVNWLGTGSLENTSITQIDLLADRPTILDSELMAGVGLYSMALGSESIYATLNYDTKSTIFRIHNSADGQLELSGSVVVPGNIFGNKGMDEQDGVLRVINSMVYVGPDSILPSAFVTTIGEVDGQWQVLGTFQEFGNGQEILSVAFEGDQAIVATGVQRETSRDHMLHIIDLSDPSEPRELSRIAITGTVTSLIRVDDDHWLGVGSRMIENHQVLQLSLFDVTDAVAPQMIATWIEQSTESGRSSINWWGWPGTGLSYDENTGIFSLGTSNYQYDPVSNIPMGSVLFAVDVDADEPIRLLDRIDNPEMTVRDLVIGDYVVTVSANAVTSHAIDDLPGKPVDRVLLPFDRSQPVFVSYVVQQGESVNVPLLGRWTDELYEIVSIETDGAINVTATPDQQLLIDASSPDSNSSQQIIVRVRYKDGQDGIFHLSVGIPYFAAVTNEDPSTGTQTVGGTQTAGNDATATIDAHLENAQGETVVNPAVGDEVWIVVEVQDTRSTPLGVFGAYVHVSIKSDNLSIVGEPEHLGEFVNARLGSVTDNGVDSLGGFTSSLTPSGSGDLQRLARIKVRVTAEGPLEYTVTPATGMGREFLLFGVSSRLAEANIQAFDSTLSTRQRTLGGVGSINAMDINADGVVTPLDILLVINRLNAQADSQAPATNSTASPAVSTAAAGLGNTEIDRHGGQSVIDSLFDFDVDGHFTDGDVRFMIEAFNKQISTLASDSMSTANTSLARIRVDAALSQLEEEDEASGDDSLSTELHQDWTLL